MRKTLPYLILLVSLLLAACASPTAEPAPTLDATQVEEMVNATLTAVAPTEGESPTEAPPPTEVPPTATQVPTPTATDTPESIEGDPAELLGEPDGMDTYDSNTNWTLFNTECFQSEITGGKYVMTAKGLEGIICWEVSWPQIEDFYVDTMVLMPDQCQANDRFGMLFRAPDNNRGYQYGLTCDGKYSLTLWDGEKTTVLVEPTESEVINVGLDAVNRLGVAAYGSRYYLHANGVFLTEVFDTTFNDTGKLGYFVRASTTQGFVVEYDNLAVWQLDDQFIPPSAPPPPSSGVLPTAEPGVPTVTSTTYVNVRSGPGTQYPVLITAPPGSTGEAVGISSDGAWYAVEVPTSVSGNGIGWVSADFVIASNTENLPVIPAPPLPPGIVYPPPDATAPTVTTFEPLNVRSGPGNQYPSYGVAPIDTTFQVVGVSVDGGWYAVLIPPDTTAEGIGWVNANYVTLSNPSNVEIPVITNPEELPPINPPPPDAGEATVTTIDAVNVRNGPSNKCTSYRVPPIGSTAPAIGVSADSGFVVNPIPPEIAADGIGWVNANYVTTNNAENLQVMESQLCP